MRTFLYSFLIIIFYSCTTLEEPERSLVVEAYIYENRVVENIKLSLVDPISNQASVDDEINARVFIIWNDIYFPLTETDKGNYSLLNSTLEISSGNSYELLIQYNNQEIRGQTTVPDIPIDLHLDKDTIDISSSSDIISVNWENLDQKWYLGVIKEIDPDITEFPFNNFFSVPTQKSSLEISTNDIQNEGSQEFILYGITEEYEDIYRISSSSIGSSNAGNLTNGFGIFAAFSSDTLDIIAVEK